MHAIADILVEASPYEEVLPRLMVVGGSSAWRQALQHSLEGAVPPACHIDWLAQWDDLAERLETLSIEPLGVVLVSPEGNTPATRLRQLLEASPDTQLIWLCHDADLPALPADDCRRSDRLLLLPASASPLVLTTCVNSQLAKWRLEYADRRQRNSRSRHIQDTQRVVTIIEECLRELEVANEDLRRYANELACRLDERTQELLGTRDLTMFALAQLADSRDPETGEHLERMRAYAQRLARHLGQQGPYVEQITSQFLEDFYRSTPLHDIGKVGIPDQILLKPGKLTPAEFDIMKCHTVIGAEALEKAAQRSSYGGFLYLAASIARHHHEKFDGSGYPDGLAGLDIPLAARITAVADVFDALTSARVYKEAMPPEQARQLIEREAGRHFDPVIVEAFVDCYEGLLQVKSQIDGSTSPI